MIDIYFQLYKTGKQRSWALTCFHIIDWKYPEKI